jgi:hypothetical protein
MNEQPGDSIGREFLFPVGGGVGMNAVQFDSWIAFNRGVQPGIHPEYWPESVDPALRESLRDDHRAIRHLFSGQDGFPEWVPSWHRDDSDPVVGLLMNDPGTLRNLHLLLCASVARNSLPRLISTRERKSIREFLGERIHDLALFVMRRWDLPPLEPWMPADPAWSDRNQLSSLGGLILEGALSSAPVSFRNQIFLGLPPSARPSQPIIGEGFRERSSAFILKVAGEAKDILSIR